MSDRESGSSPLRKLPLDRYGEFKPVGEGGMGIVYWAIDSDLNREVAFKIIRPDASGAAVAPDRPTKISPPPKETPASQAFETLKQRFLQEAWITSGMAHPGIVPVYELGQTSEGVPYYTMRFISGERTLATAIEEAKERDFEERLQLLEPFLKVCDTLRYAHSRGVIHRDLKPENIAIGEFGEVVLLDWGLAKVKGSPALEQDRLHARVAAYREATDLKTVAGMMGTPGYMAPEAAFGESASVDERSDVYSLGVMLFEILTGRRPIEFQTFEEMARKLMGEDPPPAHDIDAAVPPALSELCADCLSRERDRRPSDAHVLAAALRTWRVEREREREIEGYLREAKTSLEAANGLRGADMLRQVDRCAAAVSEVLKRSPNNAVATSYQRRAEALREKGIRERERGARKQAVVRGGIASLVVAVVAAILVATALNRRRQEAEDARHKTAQERDAKADALKQAEEARRKAAEERDAKDVALKETEKARQKAAAERDAKMEALRQVRALALASASADAAGRDHMLALLLAREAVRAEPSEMCVTRLHEAVVDSLARVVFNGHTDKIIKAVFSPTGDKILTSSRDKTARLWDLAGNELAILGGHGSWVDRAAFSPAGDRILTASAGWGRARLWDLSGKALAVVRHGKYSERSRNPAPISSAEFSPDGARLLTSAADGTVRLWDLSGRQLALVKHEGRRKNKYMRVTAKFSAAGDRILTCFDDGTARVCNLSGRTLLVLGGSGLWVRCIAVSPDGRLVLTGAGKGRLYLWDLSGKELAVMQHKLSDGERLYVSGVEFSPDGKQILSSCGRDSRLWDLSGKELAILDRQEASRLRREFSATGDKYLTTSEGAIRLRDLSGNELAVVRGLGQAVLSPRGDAILAIAGNEAYLCDLEGCELTTRLRHGGYCSVEYSPEGDRILTAGGGWARIWDRSGKELVALDLSKAHVLATLLHPNGDRIVTQDWNPSRTRYDLAPSARLLDFSGKELAVLRHEGKPRTNRSMCATFSRTGDRILTGGPDGTALLWDRAGNRLAEMLHFSGYELADVYDVAISPSGDRMATRSSGSQGKASEPARLWDLSGNRIAVLRAERGPSSSGFSSPHGPLFSPGGDTVLTVETDVAARLWDMSGKELAALRGHEAGISSVAFSVAGDKILTTSEDKTARVWDLSGKELAVLHGHAAAVVSGVFSPQGDRVLTVSGDGAARLWDISGKPLAELPFGIRNAVFSPSGDKILTGCKDGTARFWYVCTRDLMKLADKRVLRDFAPEERARYAALLPDDE